MLYYKTDLGRLYHQDSLELLKRLPSNSVHAVITDPPYGLGEVKNISRLLQDWLRGNDGTEYVSQAGFKGKSWDKLVPPPLFWKQVIRVLKPGGYLVVFAGARTQDLMGISIRLGGAELKDEISYIGNQLWLYGSGFPKALDISKAIDKKFGYERELVDRQRIDGKKTGREGASFNVCDVSKVSDPNPIHPLAKKYEGFKTQLKPSHEPILVFQKPLSEKTIVDNILRHGTGAMVTSKLEKTTKCLIKVLVVLIVSKTT